MLADISGTKRRHIRKLKLRNLKLTIRPKLLGTCIGASMTLREPRNIIVKDEKGDLVADSHSIMARWRNYFFQLLNVHGVEDVRQTEIHIAEPVVSEASVFEIELAIENLKSHKSPGSDQIPTE